MNFNFMKKIFDTEGELKIRFGKDDIEGINKWLANSGIELHPERVYKFAKEVNDPVFGEALEFPCTAI